MAVAPVSPGPYSTGAQVPLNATVTNSSSGAVTLDELALELPSGWSVVPGTAKQDGATVADPYTTGTNAKLVGPYAVPGNSTSTFQVTATPSTPGTGTFSATGVLAGGQVDSTTNVNDDAPATTTLTVLGAPDAQDDQLGARRNETTDLDVLANDTRGGGTTTLTIVDDADHGTTSIVDGKIRYTPVQDYSGPDTIEYRIANEVGSDTALAHITVASPPVAPTPSALTSTGAGTAVQHKTIPLAAGQTAAWTGADPATVTRAEGTYTLDGATGEITFTPVRGWSGTAAPLTSTGTAPAVQRKTVSVPAHATVRLLDANDDPATTVTVPGKGTFVLDPSSGEIAFTPAYGYRGSTAAVAYRLTDAYGTTAESTYTPTVDAPAAPDAPARTSTGVGTTPQTSTLPAPPTDGSVMLLDAQGHPVLTVTIPQQGTYELDPVTRTVTFRAVFGFKATPTAVAYRVSDAYGQHTDGTYTPAVTAPPAPPAEQQQTTAPSGTAQETVIPVPAGGSVTLLDEQGQPAAEVRVAGVGRYAITAGRITFTPESGYAGTPPSVRYRITDAYGQETEARYQPRVTATPSTATTPDPAPAAPAASAPEAPAAARAATPAVQPGCVSRRVMRVHFKAPRGATLRNLTVAVTGAKTRKLAAARAFDVDLRGRGRELVRVTVSATAKGRTVQATRT